MYENNVYVIFILLVLNTLKNIQIALYGSQFKETSEPGKNTYVW